MIDGLLEKLKRAVSDRRLRDVHVGFDRREHLSRAWPQLRGIATKRRQRHVSRQERRQGSRRLLRSQDGRDRDRAHGAGAASAPGHPRLPILLRVPAQGRHPQPGGGRLRDARPLARQQPGDPAAELVHQSCHRARADRPDHALRIGRGRSGRSTSSTTHSGPARRLPSTLPPSRRAISTSCAHSSIR